MIEGVLKNSYISKLAGKRHRFSKYIFMGYCGIFTITTEHLGIFEWGRSQRETDLCRVIPSSGRELKGSGGK